jgi:glycosyltransferase involved in cell wall biosynthesis
MRVTHVVHDLHGGGFESLIAAMASRLAGSPIALSAVSLSGRVGRVGDSIRPLLDQYHVMPPASALSMLAPTALSGAIRATRPDVVHLHSGVWYKGSLAARRAGVRGVVYTEHGREHRDPLLMRALDRLAARRTDVVVAVSDRLGRYLVSAVGVRADQVVTIRNGVDTDRFAPGPVPAEFRKALGVAEDALVVGSIGRLEPVKAYERLIETVVRLRRSAMDRPLQCVVWGDGSERSGLEARIRAVGLEGVMLLPGWTGTPVLAHRLLDVFVLTSHSEGTSVSLLESLACGTAPVLMDVGGNADVLGPELAAQLTPPGDIGRFAEVLASTLRDPERRARAGAAGRARVLSAFGFDAMMARYIEVYERAAGGPGARESARRAIVAGNHRDSGSLG